MYCWKILFGNLLLSCVENVSEEIKCPVIVMATRFFKHLLLGWLVVWLPCPLMVCVPMSLGFPWTVTQLRTRLLFLAELVFSFFLVSIWPIECCGVCKCVSVCGYHPKPTMTSTDMFSKMPTFNSNLVGFLWWLCSFSLGCFSLVLLGVSLVTFKHFISNDLNNFYLLKGICIALASAGDVGVPYTHTHEHYLHSSWMRMKFWAVAWWVLCSWIFL